MLVNRDKKREEFKMFESEVPLVLNFRILLDTLVVFFFSQEN